MYISQILITHSLLYLKNYKMYELQIWNIVVFLVIYMCNKKGFSVGVETFFCL